MTTANRQQRRAAARDGHRKFVCDYCGLPASADAETCPKCGHTVSIVPDVAPAAAPAAAPEAPKPVALRELTVREQREIDNALRTAAQLVSGPIGAQVLSDAAAIARDYARAVPILLGGVSAENGVLYAMPAPEGSEIG